jgi:hypothetical protein
LYVPEDLELQVPTGATICIRRIPRGTHARRGM